MSHSHPWLQPGEFGLFLKAATGSEPRVVSREREGSQLPVPDLVVVVHQTGYITSLNHLDTADAGRLIDSALR